MRNTFLINIYKCEFLMIFNFFLSFNKSTKTFFFCFQLNFRYWVFTVYLYNTHSNGDTHVKGINVRNFIHSNRSPSARAVGPPPTTRRMCVTLTSYNYKLITDVVDCESGRGVFQWCKVLINTMKRVVGSDRIYHRV